MELASPWFWGEDDRYTWRNLPPSSSPLVEDESANHWAGSHEWAGDGVEPTHLPGVLQSSSLLSVPRPPVPTPLPRGPWECPGKPPSAVRELNSGAQPRPDESGVRTPGSHP